MTVPRISDEPRASERAAGFDFYVDRSKYVPVWRVYRAGRHMGMVAHEAAGFVATRWLSKPEGGCVVASAPFASRRKAAEWLAGFQL